jgi:AcrR family transcriptional regulator
VTATDVKRAGARRGRPPQSEADTAAARARIVKATAEVFAEHGSHGLSVALIIERAGIARPTFYR